MDVRFIAFYICFFTIIRESSPDCTHDIPHGKVTWWCETTTGSTCPYSCDEGYEQNEDAHWIACSSSGEWLPMIFRTSKALCTPKSCPGTIPNGKLSDDCDDKVGTTCEYSCNTGYQKNITVSTISCEPSTNWSSDPHSLCNSNQQCPYEVKHGDLDLSCQRIPGESCNFTCIEGYLPSQTLSSSALTCEPSLVWSQPLSSLCEKIICPLEIPNGAISTVCGRQYKNYCHEFDCNTGYSAPAAAPHLRCNASGQWYWNKHMGDPCARTDELCPSKIKNGDIVWHCHRQHGATCTYGCNSGCTEDRSISWLNCGNNSKWDKNTDTLCTCEYDEATSTTSRSTAATSTTTVPSTPTTSVTTVATSVSNPCPDTVPAGHIDPGCHRRPFSICSYTCNSGCDKTYGSLYCSDQGFWYNEETACICYDEHVTSTTTEPIHIPNLCPYYIPNGHVSTTCSRTHYSNCYDYTCYSGCHKMKSWLYCTGFGNWTDGRSACSCQGTNSPPTPDSFEESFNSTPVIIGIVIAVVAIAIASVVCCMWFKKTRQQSQPSTYCQQSMYYNRPELTRTNINNRITNHTITPVSMLQNQTNVYTSIQQQGNTTENPYTQLQPSIDELDVRISEPPAYSSIADLEPKEDPPPYELVISNPSDFKG